jgi:hypothetical protein
MGVQFVDGWSDVFTGSSGQTRPNPENSHDITIHANNDVTIGCQGPHKLKWWEDNGERLIRKNGISVNEEARATAILMKLSQSVRFGPFHLTPEAIIYKWRATGAEGEKYLTEKQPTFDGAGSINLDRCGATARTGSADGRHNLTRCKIERIAE